MSQTVPEIVRVGDSGARILRVTQESIEYLDMTGQSQSIDLQDCARNWVRWHGEHSEEFIPVPCASQIDIDMENAHCVGQRGADDRSWWIELMNQRKTRFEFETWEALCME